MYLFSADAKIFFLRSKILFLPTKSWKNHPKSCLETLKSTFFLNAWATQTAQTEEFMFQNVAYKPTAYKTGVCLSKPFLWGINLTRKIGKSDLLMIYLFFRSCFLAKLKKSLMSSNRHNLSKYKNRFSDKLQNASPVLTFRYFIKEKIF